jgi:hypothetical protein
MPCNGNDRMSRGEIGLPTVPGQTVGLAVAIGCQVMVHACVGHSVTVTHWDSLLCVSECARVMAKEFSRGSISVLADLESGRLRAVSHIVADSGGNPGSVRSTSGLVQAAGCSGASSVFGGTSRLVGIWLGLALRSDLLAVGSGFLGSNLGSSSSSSQESNDSSLRELHFEWFDEAIDTGRMQRLSSERFLSCRKDKGKRARGGC